MVSEKEMKEIIEMNNNMVIKGIEKKSKCKKCNGDIKVIKSEMNPTGNHIFDGAFSYNEYDLSLTCKCLNCENISYVCTTL